MCLLGSDGLWRGTEQNRLSSRRWLSKQSAAVGFVEMTLGKQVLSYICGDSSWGVHTSLWDYQTSAKGLLAHLWEYVCFPLFCTRPHAPGWESKKGLHPAYYLLANSVSWDCFCLERVPFPNVHKGALWSRGGRVHAQIHTWVCTWMAAAGTYVWSFMMGKTLATRILVSFFPDLSFKPWVKGFPFLKLNFFLRDIWTF